MFEYHASAWLNNISILSGILITANMVLHMNDAYIIYHHMDTSQSLGLAQSYFLILTIWSSSGGSVLLFYINIQ